MGRQKVFEPIGTLRDQQISNLAFLPLFDYPDNIGSEFEFLTPIKSG